MTIGWHRDPDLGVLAEHPAPPSPRGGVQRELSMVGPHDEVGIDKRGGVDDSPGPVSHARVARALPRCR